MQITAGSLAGAFGRNARYWAERMLAEGYVHILATDAHDTERRPPNLGLGRDIAAKSVGSRRGHQNGAFSAFGNPIEPNAKRPFCEKFRGCATRNDV